ncbi:hypothetical protein IV203_003198 [Nitzschia inconspicua]|uniref:Uncharacterized protein n=1 Tax=Nitzschia inconspicua TaxID=303405 RepID=A0A9K3L1G7_9STRA|nr:hypothetical protein IV203_003198 [Nitzschia inconspicua]
MCYSIASEKDELQQTVSANVAMKGLRGSYHVSKLTAKVMTMLRGIVPMSQDQVRFGTDDSDLALKVDFDKTQPMSLAEDGYDDRDHCTDGLPINHND